MSRFIVVLCAAAVLVPAAQANAAVKAVVKFSSTTTREQRLGTVRHAGGRVLRVRGMRVVARMSSSAADQLRCAMGVISVRVG